MVPNKREGVYKTVHPLSFSYIDFRLQATDYTLDALENIIYAAHAGDCPVFVLFLVEIFERSGLVVIYVEAFLYRFQVVVAATRNLSAFQQTVDQLLLLDFEAQNDIDLSLTLGQHAGQSLGLGYGAGESVEYHTLLALLVRIEHVGQNIDHQVVGKRATWPPSPLWDYGC